MEKTGGAFGTFDAGAISNQTLSGDGYVECVAQATNDAMIGFDTVDTNQNFTAINFAAYLSTSLYTWEEAGAIFVERSTLAQGDVIRVRRTGTTISFEKNGSTVHTSGTAQAGSIFIDTSIGTLNSSLGSIKLYDAGVQVAITWTNAVNVTLTQP